MKFFGWALRAVVCIFVLTAQLALAGPTLERVTDSGGVEGRTWEFELLRVSGLEAQASARIHAHLETMRLAWIRRSSGAAVSGVMRAPLVTDDVISITMTGTDTGETSPLYESVLFDPRTGSVIAPEALFVPGGYARVQQQFARRLTARGAVGSLEEGLALRLHAPSLDPSGLTLISERGEREAFPWSALQRELDPQGPLRAFAAREVDLALGGDPEPAADEALTPRELHMRVLEDRLAAVVPALSWDAKRAVLTDERWQDAWEFDPLVELLEEGPEDLQDAIYAAIAHAQEVAPLERSSVEDAEATLISSVVPELATRLRGVVVGSGPMTVTGQDGQRAWELGPDEVVGLEGEPRPEGVVLVRTAAGHVGYAPTRRLLIESLHEARGRVARLPSGALVFELRRADGEPVGPRLLPKDGPGSPDAELEALQALVEPATGTSPRVLLDAVRHEVADRPPWLTVHAFERLDSEGPSGTQPASPGLVDQLEDR